MKPPPANKAFPAQSSHRDPSLGLISTLYLHPASGARVLDVQSADRENLMSVLFQTPPTDNTGLPHILEHSVLGGSQRYPVKDPFFHMLKMSLATFLNAMTGPDYTIYPCASNVTTDFFNLADVYLDAVFHPLLAPNHFAQEGYHFEFDPPGDTDGRLTVKGIVYNEMRGAYSSANERMQRAIERGLFPDTLYRHDAGGDPDAMLSLSYDDFLAFHRRYYHPSNALIVHYGDIPPSDWMPFLDQRLHGFTPQAPAPVPSPQPRWLKPRAMTDGYPIGATESPTERAYLAMSWLTAHSVEPFEQIAQEALFRILLGHAGAPLYRALIDARLGHDLTHSYTHAFGREQTFHVGLKGTEPDRVTAFESLVLTTLRKLATPGAIGPEMIETALTRLGYMFQEISDGFPLKLASQIYNSWAPGGDPFAWLNGREVLEALRERINHEPDFFEQRIRSLLLDNPHRLTTILQPDPGLGARQEAAVAQRLEARKQGLSTSERETIRQSAAALQEFQQREETAESLARLPQLQARDLPRRPQLIPSDIVTASPTATILRQPIPSNGVNYLALALDIQPFHADDLQLMNAIFSHVALQMGAAGGDYATTSSRIAAHTGNLQYELLASPHGHDPDHYVIRLVMTAKFLDQQVEPALKLIDDLLRIPEFDDPGRMTDLLTQLREQHHSHVVENALGYAMPLAARHLGPFHALMHHIGGLTEMRQVDHWANQIAANPSVLPRRLDQLSGQMRRTGHLAASFTGSDQAFKHFTRVWPAWQPDTPRPDNRGTSIPDGATQRFDAPRQGLAAPMDVAFNVMSLPLPHVSHPDSVLLEIGAHILSFDYLLDEIRFKGAAYGAGCAYRPAHGVAHLYSYRDPSIERTLDIFRGLPDAARRAPWQQADIDRGILGVARNNLRPLRPGSATRTALTRHLQGLTDPWLIERHERLLAATPADVKRALEQHLEAGMPRAGLCIVASRERLTALPATVMESLTIEDVLT